MDIRVDNCFHNKRLLLQQIKMHLYFWYLDLFRVKDTISYDTWMHHEIEQMTFRCGSIEIDITYSWRNPKTELLNWLSLIERKVHRIQF